VASGISFSSWFKLFNDPKSSTIGGKWSALAWPPADALRNRPQEVYGYMTTWMVGLARNSAEKEMGWELIRHLTSKATLKTAAAKFGMQSARKSVWEDSAVRGTLLTADATLAQLQKASPPWPLGTNNAVQILDVLGEELQLAYLGRKSVSEALGSANDRARQLLR
jgi:ABC-type glycerol-3-phosphate transport system substrate-binding protein